MLIMCEFFGFHRNLSTAFDNNIYIILLYKKSSDFYMKL